MNKQEQYKIEKEIDFLSKQLDLDKFHYIRSVSNFITKITILITIFIGLISIIISYEELNLLMIIKTILIIVISIIVVIKILKFKDDYKGQIGGYKKDVDARNKVMRDSYVKLGVNIDKLDNEFKRNGGSIR